MMNMKTTFRTLLSATAILVLIPAFSLCSRYGKSKGQSTEFATFIKAYTGGIISDKSTIRVELTSDMPDVTPGQDVKDGILSFSPSIKGTTRWLNQRTLEFIPDPGALKSGQAYTGKLRLDKIQKVSSRKFRKFSFNFLVAIKEAILSLESITITASSPDKAAVEGLISLTEELPLEKVQSMLEFNYSDNSAELNVTAAADPLHFRFDVLNLQRDDKDHLLTISMKPHDTGFVTDSRLEITIPAMNDFKVLSAERVEAEDPYIDIYFTEALADIDDASGLFTLSGVGRFYSQIENSRVKLFYESASDEFLTLNISEAVKSYLGIRLGAEFTKEFPPTEEKPAVEIPISGTILPNAKELLLPFKAVNLNAVDIRVIQIYEENVLMFLQDNDLGGDNSLRRSGRLVYKRCLRLDSDPFKNLHKWQDFSIDLSGLFKQEPGAIYRIRISFKPEYSLYGKSAEFKSGTPSDELVDISSEDLTEEDKEAWDRPYPHFYESWYDWDEYEWEDRDNPLKPTYYMDEDRFPVVNLLTSHLGVIAKYSGGDKLWVSVNDILSTEPVFNAELYVYSYQLKDIGFAKTGTNGMAEIQLDGKPFIVVAKRGDATSYLKVTEGDEKSLSRFDVGGEVLDKGLKAFIYGERGVWRPGDTLHVTMILEDKEDKIPDSHPAIMELYTPEGQYYTKMVNGNASNGFYVFNIITKPDDPTGTWNAYFKLGGATFHKALRIESVKPNRLKIDLALGEGALDGGTTVPITLTSNWLTGPPASGLAAKVDMTLRKGGSSFKGFEGYRFTDPISSFSTSEHVLLDTRLNENGQVRINVKTPAAEGAPGMLTADLVCTVEEPGGDISFSTQTTGYSPYSAYVGVKLPEEKDSYYVETDKDYEIKVALVDKDGARVSGHSLSYAIYKLQWSWWWESRAESLDSYVNGYESAPISSGTIRSGNGDASIAFRIDYPEWGRYLVYVKDETGGHASGDILYVDWPSYRGRSSKADPDALAMLTFSTDKSSYEVGETVRLYIPSASKGQALVSIENSRAVLSREWVKTSGEEDATYSFKVTPEMAPNFYLHVSLIQPHERADNDLPIRLYGVQPILVNDKASHLTPEITMPDIVRPEEEFTVKIKEKNGKPMTYTLAVVDEGLLDLTNFKTPDPWNAMYKREALGVRTWDLYDDIIGAYSGRFSPMFSIGGDESATVNAKKDNRFNAIVKFLGPFSLNGGSATHKIKLPMYVGSVRVMVVAARNAAYGNAEKTVPVRSPLMVLSTLPRVLGSGEKVSLPVNVFALEDAIKNATVTVKTEGPLKIDGASETSVSFSKPGDQLVRFNLVADEAGIAKVTVTANGSGYKASETISIEVRNPNPPTIAVSRAVLAKGETKRMSYTPFTSSETEWATLEIASFPSIDYNSIYSFLIRYPYNCSEQLAARGISLLAIKDVMNEKQKELIDKTIPDILQQLYVRQRPNGGFSYWPGASNDDNWVTSMAGQFMVEASNQGYPVSKGVLASWSRYQKKAVQDYRRAKDLYLNDLEQAYRLYTLALNGETESGAMNRLKESEELSAQAGWMLASAYAISGKKNISKEMIGALKTDFVDYDEVNYTFGSSTRDQAIALETLALIDEIPAAMEVAQEISKALSDEYYSSQQVAFATHAMGILAGKVNTGALEAELTQGGDSRSVKSAKSVYSTNLDTRTGSLDVKNNSEGTVYLTLMTATQTPFGERVEAKSSGISLFVEYLAENGKPLDPAEIQQGSDFSVRITVGNTSGMRDYTNLALTQMVPSGWEIMNDRLLGTSSNSSSYSYRDIRDDRVSWHFDLSKGASKTFTMKLHAAYEGEFTLPAVKCEALYDTRVNANTASGVARVVR